MTTQNFQLDVGAR